MCPGVLHTIVESFEKEVAKGIVYYPFKEVKENYCQ
jgi:hypothetical protein